MSSKRPDGRSAFLGTEEIVRRLRSAQPSRLGGVPTRLFRLGVATAGAVIVGWLWQHLPRTAFRAPARGSAAEAVAVVSAANLSHGNVVAEAPGHGPQQPTAPAQGTASATGHRRLAVRLRCTGASGTTTLWVDGLQVAATGVWEGELPAGHHVLRARAKGAELSRALDLHASGAEIVFDFKDRRTHHRSPANGHVHKAR